MKTTLEENKLVKLAKKYGTPLYVYDGDLIKQKYNELYELINWKKLKIFFAMKANYNPSILKLLLKEGASLDTVSPGDVLLALKIGFPVDRILYTANNLTDEEMRMVAGKGILMNIGSLSRLEKYGKEYPNTNVCLRFNPEVIAGEFDKVQTAGALTKFGILIDDIEKVKQIVKKYNLKVIGIHSHTGSGIADTKKFIASMNQLMRVGKKENFPDLKFLDFGGGFKVPYSPDEHKINYVAFGKEIVKVFSQYCKEYGKDLELYFEPGKYIVAQSGYLLVEVNTIKNNRGRIIVGTNTGFPQIIRPTYYGAYHHILNITNTDGKKGKYDIFGNICEGGDVLARERKISQIREGDILSIQNAGAYCYSMGGVYNLRPMPAEVMVSSGKDKLVRKRLSFDELTDQILSESI